MTGWADPDTVARGSATTSRRWLDTTATWLETHAQYDQLGNLRKSWDARGNVSQVAYSASYHFAYPTSTTSPVPDPSGLRGSTTALVSSTVYDFSTGLVVSTTDANGEVTTFEYNDPLDRLTRVMRPDTGYTSFEYGRNGHGDFARTRTKLNTAGALTDAYEYFDGLGRPCRSFSYDPQDALKPWLTSDTAYDALGRAWKASDTYRSTGNGTPAFSSGVWTETEYDALGRVRVVTTMPDGAVVTTTYSGQYVMVTDQAGKLRRSKTDALRRLVRVVEPDAAGNLGTTAAPAQPTSYTYDALGNLRKVDQGGQLRFFMYDSLSRLIRARYPEQGTNSGLAGADPVTGNSQWSLAYAYDAAGNLITRSDPRGTSTWYAYDALNRNTLIDYTDTTRNPDVERSYDGAANGRGRFWHDMAYSPDGTKTERTAVDTYDAVGRPLSRRQLFSEGGAWSAAYTSQYAYDLAGGVTSHTYPSGRVVNYTYDATGRLQTFTGRLGDGVLRTYADQLRYDEGGHIEQERFGTQTPVYSKSFYNVRDQLSEIRISTYALTHQTQGTNWNRGAIINHYSSQSWAGSGTDNNGNLRKQDVYIPTDDAITGSSLTTQFYDYDSLNRLDKVREERAGVVQWQQDYLYDRWGNRTISASGTTGNVPKPQFTVSTTTNRLGVPAGYTGVMQYDAAGNLTHDTYTGAGARTYDVDGRMTSAQDSAGRTSRYTYDGDGRRVRRKVGAAAEVWQVSGAGGELLAEYVARASPSSPQKEYGYRAGALLVTVEAVTASGTPEPVVWTGAVGVSVSGNDLTKSAGALAWDGGASSTKAIGSGDGYLEFTATETTKSRMMGLSHSDSNQTYADFDFAI